MVDRPLRALRDERGAVTAEFAVVLPAVLVVLVLAISSVMLATHRIGLTAAAAETARLEARGDHAAAAQVVGELSGHVRVERGAHGALHCVTLLSSPARGLLAVIELSARACAARSESS